MKILLSCAKKQVDIHDFANQMPPNAHAWLSHCNQPHYQSRANELISQLQKMSGPQIQDLMSISHKLAELNKGRYQTFNPDGADLGYAVPALWLFAGDAYNALDAASLLEDDINYLSHSLCILSGLYGVLSALDWVQPYRLEMKTPLSNSKGHDLYQFWQEKLSNDLLQTSGPILNLASQEYAKVFDRHMLNDRWVDVTFYDFDKSGQQKVIGLKAKRARGAMVRWCAQNQVIDIDQASQFNRNYTIDKNTSTDKHLIFIAQDRA